MHSPIQRRGAATLEFAMSLPILLALFVVIVWLGFSVTSQSAVAVQARHKAWKERFEAQNSALLFLKDDFSSQSADGEVNVTPLLDGLPQPKSKHDVMAATWDHRELKLDKTPNWKEYAKAAANAKTAGAQVAYTDARNDFNQWKQTSSRIWSTLGQQILSELTNLGSLAKSQSNNAQSETANTSRERSKLQSQIAAKRREIVAAEKRLGELRRDGDASKERVAIQKNKIKRLRNELREMNNDLDDLND